MLFYCFMNKAYVVHIIILNGKHHKPTCFDIFVHSKKIEWRFQSFKKKLSAITEGKEMMGPKLTKRKNVKNNF